MVDESVLLASSSETVGLIKRVVGFMNDPTMSVECIRFDYPVSLLVYDENLLIRDHFSIESNQSFVNVLGGLNENEKISISYPIFGELTDGTRLEINNNEQLKLSVMSCVEDEVFDKITQINANNEKCYYAVPFVLGEDNTYAGAIIDITSDKQIKLIHKGVVYKGTINSAVFGVETLFNINFEGNSQVANDWNFSYDFQLFKDGIIFSMMMLVQEMLQ